MSVCPSSEQRKGQLQRSQQIPGTQTINATNPEGRTALVLLGLDAQGEEVLLLEIKELADDKGEFLSVVWPAQDVRSRREREFCSFLLLLSSCCHLHL